MNFLERFVLLFSLALSVGCNGNENRADGHLTDNLAAELESVTIYKSDQSIQCESKGIGLDVMKNELTSAGVEVLCAKKGDTGLFVIAMCGAPTARINIYSIQASDWPRAEQLGFRRIEELADYTGGHGCQESSLHRGN